MPGRALPEEFRVAAANVIGIKGESIGELIALCQPVADLTDARREKCGDLLDCFA
jgi:hypothetical protein